MTLTQRLDRQPLAVRRGAALSLLIAVVLTGWFLIFEPLRFVVTSQQEWRAEVRQTIGRSRGLAAMTFDLQKAVDELASLPAWTRFYRVARGTDGGALIHRDVASLCSDVGATILSLTPLPSRKEGELDKIGVRFSATMTADQLKAFIVRLRAFPQYLRTEEMSISAPQMQSPETNPTLTVTLELFGYAQESAA
jgi:hypothetical protein